MTDDAKPGDRRLYIERAANGWITEELFWDAEKDCWRPQHERRVYQDRAVLLDDLGAWV